MALVIAAAVVAWMATGDAVDGAEANHDAAGAALTQAIAVAQEANSMANQMQNSVDALVVGTGSTSEALTHTVYLSQNVQALLEIVNDLVDDVSEDAYVEIHSGLAEARAAILETQGGINESQQQLIGTQPAIQSAISALEPIGDQLRAAQSQLADSDGAYDNQLGLWRAALVLATLALLLVFFAVDRLTRQR